MELGLKPILILSVYGLSQRLMFKHLGSEQEAYVFTAVPSFVFL